MKDFDIAVIGAGAAGMMAAWGAAGALAGGKTVALLEGGQRMGRKLLATGNGRCNYSHTGVSAAAYNRPDLVGKVFRQCPPEETAALFSEAGLVSREEEGRLYPASGAAGSVLDVLRLALEDKQVQVFTGAMVKDLQKKGSRFWLALPEGGLGAGRVILASGGKAGGPLNCPGGGYRLAEALGHGITSLTPGLTGLCCPEEEVKELGLKALNGLRVNARASWYQNEKFMAAENGEILFRDYGLSGIAIFQLSRYPGPGRLSLDLLPEKSPGELQDFFRQRRSRLAARRAEDFFTGLFQKIVGQTLLKGAGVKVRERTCGQLTEEELCRLARRVKDWSFPVTQARGWDQAQITLGGLEISCFNPDTLESLICPGFYCAGEVLDVDGPCGGFNLQWAWSSGLLAGRQAAKAIRERHHKGGK